MSNPGLLASDAAVRAAVLDASRSWMLQAPAGSGKTELLMQRYLACLATVDEPESVLAITFTRKAAAEMRNRILRTLEEARTLGEKPLDELPTHRRSALELARRALRVSGLRGWQILDHPARLQVRTLDSFCESVAQRAPFKGQLGGMAQIAEDASPLYALAATRVLEMLPRRDEYGAAVATLLEHLDNDVRKARELLASMLAQREQWLGFLGRSDVYDEAQQNALRARLETALQEAVEEDLTAVEAAISASLTPGQQAELARLVTYANEQLHAEDRSEVLRALAAVQEEPANHAAAIRSLPYYRAVCRLLLTDKDTLRKTITKANGFPVVKEDPTQRAWKTHCEDLLKELAESPRASYFPSVLGRVRLLPEPRYGEAQWEFIRAMLQLLPLAAAHLALVFAEQGTVDFAEYAQRAMDAIGEGSDPTELGLQLGYRIRHVLVDEFQDTNRAQVELLARLLRTWEEDEGCSTFYVGDPMQSIYAFRQADVAIYQRARREGIGGRAHNFERLTQNFRSQQKLVAWFNGIFPGVLDEENEATNAVRYDLAAVPSRPALEDDAVFLRGFVKGDKLGEARYVAGCIKSELAREVPAGEKPLSIAVLVRSRSHLPALAEALRAAGIRYRAVKTDRLAERPLIRDLESLRRALADPADRTAWLAVLRAPWCGMELADLLALCRGDRENPGPVRELLDERMAPLSPRARQVLRRVLPVLDAALRERGRRPMRELVESTWLRLGGAACMAEASASAPVEAARAQAVRDAEAYFALLDAESAAGELRQPESFLEKLGELFAPPDAAPDIQVEITTIHNAKGLEWDVVFLPALERKPHNEDKSLLYWRLRRSGEEESLLLGPMEAAGAKNGGKQATIEKYMRHIAVGCAAEELKRLFYVAATRARKRLYLTAGVPAERGPDKRSMLFLLWSLPGMQAAFAPREEPAAAANVLPQVSSPLRRLPEDYTLPALPDALAWPRPDPSLSGGRHTFEWVGDLLPRVGVVAHGFLQQIAAEGIERWDSARLAGSRASISRALLAAGAAPGDLEVGVARVLEALRRTLSDERGRWLLAAHEEARSEFALSAVLDGQVRHIRVDRTFVENGVRWLVDYKIAEQQGGDRARFLEIQENKYREDLERYARALALYDPRPVRCALYLPLLGAFCPVDVA